MVDQKISSYDLCVTLDLLRNWGWGMLRISVRIAIARRQLDADALHALLYLRRVHIVLSPYHMFEGAAMQTFYAH